jgi:glycosyltransferase involved in cell wall biosynthesis
MKIAILISTRNRLTQLEALLESIARLDEQPSQVVVSASGSDISNVLSKYSKIFRVSHVKTDLYGQIRQKMLGIMALDDSIEWTIFLDDDVLLPRDFLEKLTSVINFWKTSSTNDLLGVGFRIPSTSHLIQRSKVKIILSKLFFLNGSVPGEVLGSGHPVPYVNSKEIIETKWLNGISAWSSTSLAFYGSDYLESRYSAFEDVIFSYNQSKFGQLIYVPGIEIDFQPTMATDLSNPIVFESASYWRLKFILANNEFSRPKYLWSQIGRSIFFIVSSKETPKKLAMSMFKAFLIFWEITFQLTIKKNANWSLNRHCKNM